MIVGECIMIIKVDNTYYSVNISKYKGSSQSVADKVVSEIFRRINVSNLSLTEKRQLRAKIYSQYHQQSR